MTLTVCFVHRRDQHGISRYGERIAEFVADHSDVRVLPGRSSGRPPGLIADALGWRKADVLHVQWSPEYWGRGPAAVARALLLAASRRPIVITMHDVHHEPMVDARATHPMTPGRIARLTRTWRGRAHPANVARRVVLRSASTVLVFSPEEATALRRRRAGAIAVVPHFVEPAYTVAGPTRDQELIVFGFIHPRKGQRLAVESLVDLPDANLVICGAAEDKHMDYLAEIHRTSETLGVSDRVTHTGHVSTEDLPSVLGSARVALAPYQRIAASGSLSTLIAHRLPLVVHDTAYSRRLAERAPHAITLFSPWTREALTAAIRRSMSQDRALQLKELDGLAVAFGPAATATIHVSSYREATR